MTTCAIAVFYFCDTPPIRFIPPQVLEYQLSLTQELYLVYEKAKKVRNLAVAQGDIIEAAQGEVNLTKALKDWLQQYLEVTQRIDSVNLEKDLIFEGFCDDSKVKVLGSWVKFQDFI